MGPWPRKVAYGGGGMVTLSTVGKQINKLDYISCFEYKDLHEGMRCQAEMGLICHYQEMKQSI